jgi:glutaredoxin 3
MSHEWIVYSRTVCPYCTQAKKLLESKGYTYTEINIDTNAAGRDLLIEEGLKSVPQIYHSGELIGGFDKLKVWLELKEQTL